MSRLDLCIIADDLTGALDAAAPFARLDRSVVVPLHPGPVAGASALSVSTESRDLPRDAALARGAAMLAAFEGQRAQLWFKKIDSVLRGSPFAETAQLMRHGGFATCLFTPAFPAMGRLVRNGVLLSSADAPLPGKAGARDMQAAFAREGLSAGPESSDAPLRVIDAQHQADLDAVVSRWRGRLAPLWAGSRGLAQALAGAVTPLTCPAISLVMIGTSHPATRQQVARLQNDLTPAPMTGRIRPTFSAPILLDPVAHSDTPAETRQALCAAIARLDPGEGAFLVTGGATLSTLLKETEAQQLLCLGEVAPGLPLAQVCGGRLDKHMLVTKSGGFGTAEQIRELILGARR